MDGVVAAARTLKWSPDGESFCNTPGRHHFSTVSVDNAVSKVFGHAESALFWLFHQIG